MLPVVIGCLLTSAIEFYALLLLLLNRLRFSRVIVHFHTLSLDVWCSEAIGFIKKLGKNNSLSYPHCSVFPFLSHSVKIATHINFSLLIDTDESNQILTEQNMGKFCFGNNFATISPTLLIFELKLKNWISHQIKPKNTPKCP